MYTNPAKIHYRGKVFHIMEKRNIPVQSVKRAFDLLDMLIFDDAAKQGIALKELSCWMSMKANSVHNILKTMVACGYVAQNENGKYIAGVKCKQIGLINQLQSESNLSVLESECEKVSQELGESVVFITLTGGNRNRLAGYDSTQAVRVDRAVFDQQNFYTTPTGRVLISFSSEKQRELILSQNGLPLKQWGNIKSIKKLEGECEVIRRKGFSIVEGSSNGLIAIAFPVFNKEGTLIGSIGCYAPQFRWAGDKPETMKAALRNAAQRITDELVL